ncbi:MAG: DUF1194 domain-containing protein [Rhodospirillales bacterium]
MLRFAAGLVVVLILALSLAHPAAALDVDVQIVLAVDVSRSIDEDEAKLQRQGYIDAISDKKVIDAMLGGEKHRIAVAYVEWAGSAYQQTIIDWTVIDSPEAARRFADKLAEAPRSAEMWTSISAGILYSAAKFENNGFESKRKVIDVSGDGRNNSGPDMATAREAVLSKGISINGLPVVNDRPNFGRPPEKDLDIYYEQNVIGGPGSFLIVAKNFTDFTRAVRAKLIREISDATPTGQSNGGRSTASLPQ